MIVCPVCEHPQESGAECEVCGKRFAPGSLPVPPVARMAELEPTLHGAVAVDSSDLSPIPELEPTSAAPVDAPEPTASFVEPTRMDPVDVDSALIPDIERQAAEIPGDARTELPLAPVCRYCRTPAVPGERMCSRCGMRLPVIDSQLIPEGKEGLHLCTNCGTVSTRGLCPACGSRLTPVTLE